MTPAEIKVEHVAGRPPGTDPQRTSETYEQYVARMSAHGFPPDINTGEAAADYSARVAASKPALYPSTVVVSAGNIVGTVASASYAISAFSASYAP